MTYDLTVQVTAKCAACGMKNQLTLSRVSDEAKVSCSHCGVALGLVGELVAASSPIEKSRAAN